MTGTRHRLHHCFLYGLGGPPELLMPGASGAVPGFQTDRGQRDRPALGHPRKSPPRGAPFLTAFAPWRSFHCIARGWPRVPVGSGLREGSWRGKSSVRISQSCHEDLFASLRSYRNSSLFCFVGPMPRLSGLLDRSTHPGRRRGHGDAGEGTGACRARERHPAQRASSTVSLAWQSDQAGAGPAVRPQHADATEPS